MKYFVLFEADSPWVQVPFRKLLEIAKSCYAIKVMYTEEIYEVFYLNDKK